MELSVKQPLLLVGSIRSSLISDWAKSLDHVWWIGLIWLAHTWSTSTGNSCTTVFWFQTGPTLRDSYMTGRAQTKTTGILQFLIWSLPFYRAKKLSLCWDMTNLPLFCYSQLTMKPPGWESLNPAWDLDKLNNLEDTETVHCLVCLLNIQTYQNVLLFCTLINRAACQDESNSRFFK